MTIIIDKMTILGYDVSNRIVSRGELGLASKTFSLGRDPYCKEENQMKNMTKLLSMLLALCMVLGLVPAMAEEAAPTTQAFLMFADAAWVNQVWNAGETPAGMTVTEATITGEGDYTVGLAFETPAEGVAFTALGIADGENVFPGWKIRINEIRVNGQAIEAKKGYTSSDDGIVPRMNIFNEWVGELPADARSWDGDLADASWMIVNKEDFASVSSFEVDFSFIKYGIDTAYIMYADAAWAQQYWLDGNEYPVTAKNATVTGAGDYTVGLDFTATEAGKASGVAFAALGIKHGETLFPGMMIKLNEVRVNGAAVELAKGYTSSDDGLETRMNLMNEWVTDLPEQARVADGNLEGATAMIATKEALSAVKTIEVTFEFIYGEPAKVEEPAMTEEEITAALAADYNAYVAVQSESYIFRNDWYDASYGRDSVDYPDYFNRLTGWDAENNAVDYGGSFVDAAITGNGTYTVTMTTGDHGFGVDTLLRFFRVTTDIPAALVKDGHVTITDCKVKIGDGKTQDGLVVVTDGDWVTIVVRDEYNKIEPGFNYMPGANTLVTFTFTVNGLAD